MVNYYYCLIYILKIYLFYFKNFIFNLNLSYNELVANYVFGYVFYVLLIDAKKLTP